jgi:hypothetical protein
MAGLQEETMRKMYFREMVMVLGSAKGDGP